MRHDGYHDSWAFAGWWLPMAFIAVLAVVAIVLVTRGPDHHRRSAPPPPAPIGPAAADPAVETVRLRYASGQIDRDEYTRVLTDLGAAPPGEATA